MEIIPATLRDIGQLRHVEQACFGKDAWPFLDLLAVLTWSDVIRLKAVEAGHMIGFIAGDQRPPGDTGWIATIGVLPEFQRQGIGRALLHACEDKLPQPCLRLCVRASNFAAIEMYRNEGYLVVDTWKKYYNDEEDALVMEKLR
jgi:ribosomal protein S18 acetylase RimI-like enzyme